MKSKVLLQPVKDYEQCKAFVERFYQDDSLMDFRFANLNQIQHNLSGAIEKGNGYGVYRGEVLVGVFGFLVITEEKYIEMTVGLSDDPEAYEMIFWFLEKNFIGCQIDFVFNPKNAILKTILMRKGAEFETEQMKMVFRGEAPYMDTTGIVPFSSEYTEQYLNIHNTDMYWTGEKVIAAPEKFRTFLAVEAGKVIGYLDVTHCFDENEPYDFMVVEACRRRGYGRKLLAKALQENSPKQMMLMVAVDNFMSIPLYESMGFVKEENENCQTVYWNRMNKQ